MGLFREFGRRAERVKQQVLAAADEPVECAACGAAVPAAETACPECGEEARIAGD